MVDASNNKNFVRLEEAFLQDDTDRRLYLGVRTPFEIDLLYEIVLGPSTNSCESLAQDLDQEEEYVQAVLERIAYPKLFVFEGTTLVVDKEERKKFQVDLERFNPSFVPNVPYVRSLLHRVGMDRLLSWYTLPRTSDDILQSLIDQTFVTPKAYERHMQELLFEDPTYHKILSFVLDQPNYAPTLDAVAAHVGIPLDTLHKYIQIMEVSLVLFLGVEETDGGWYYTLEPLSEWRQLRSLEQKRVPVQLPQEEVEVEDEDYLQQLSQALSEIDRIQEVSKEKIHYIKDLIQLHFVRSEKLELTQEGHKFLASDPMTQSRSYLRMSLRGHHKLSERAIHSIEKSLHKALGWVDLDQFLDVMHVPLKDHNPPQLQEKGKKSSYVFPEYSQEERVAIKTELLNRLRKGGVIRAGRHRGRSCFCLTRFGQEYTS